LDFATDAALRHALSAYSNDITIITVSQRVTTIKNSDKIIVMDDGIVVGEGTHDELFAANDVYREICLSQLSESEAMKHE
ncbi:MAG: ABC transporter ATP-binding protein, partial [Christensenella sp.]